MIPAIVLAGSPSDALLCDCGEEVVRLYTFDLMPGAMYYAIDGHLYELDHSSLETMPVVRAEPNLGVVAGFNLITNCQPLKGPFEFTAHATCDTCTAKRFRFRVDGVVLTCRD